MADFQAITTQEELDNIIKDRLKRDREAQAKKYEGWISPEDHQKAVGEATKALNDWVKKQRNFVDAVSLLIQKLDELNKIRDYGEEFWKETRTEMNKTVSTITKGSETLQSELAGIDRQSRMIAAVVGDKALPSGHICWPACNSRSLWL